MNDYQKQATRTLKAETPDLTHNEYMIIWCLLGLVSESGEIANYLKKGILHRHGVDVNHVKEELGDISWYIANLCTLFDLDLDDVHQGNIEKLMKRYPNGFSFEDSIRRVDLTQE